MPLSLPRFPLNFHIRETFGHRITVTYPDGKTDEFGINISPTSNRWDKIDYVDISITPLPGTYSTLEPLYVQTSGLWFNGNIDWPATLLEDNWNVFNPDTYKLTTIDGTVFIINQKTGV